MNDRTTSFSDFITERMVMKGYSSSTLAQIAGVSNRIIVEARMGLLENMLRNGITRRKLLGVSRSIPRLLRALDADEEYWVNKLGLHTSANRTTPRTHQSPQTLASRVRFIMDKPVEARHIAQINKVHRALGDMFTTEMLSRILLRETQ
jgi:hypothetical protein